MFDDLCKEEKCNIETLKYRKEELSIDIELYKDKVRKEKAKGKKYACSWEICGVSLWWLLTSSEMSSLLGKFWLTAAKEACSMSRIHLLMLSMDESHSRWPGALSLRINGEQKQEKTKALTQKNDLQGKRRKKKKKTGDKREEKGRKSKC